MNLYNYLTWYLNSSYATVTEDFGFYLRKDVQYFFKVMLPTVNKSRGYADHSRT